MIGGMTRAAFIAVALALVHGGPAQAESAADFYRGKTLTVLIGSGSGGGVDQVARAVARHLGKHVPGAPVVVPKNMGGGGGVQLLNYVNTVAPKDGTTIGFVLPSLVFDPLFVGKQAGEGFDPKTMQWLGGPARYASVAIAWNPWTKVRKAADLLTQDLVVGASAAASSSGADAFIMRNILGYRYRVVTGYPSGAAMDLAMQRGETQGRANIAWYGIKSRNSAWLRDGTISLLYQMGLKKNPSIPDDVPLVLDFTSSAIDRQMLELKFSAYDVGYALMGPPQTPSERVAVLRTALADTFNDPAYRADAEREQLEVDPVAGMEVEAIIRRAYATPSDVIARLIEAMKPPR
jgi:tripartite-type tricarboxylate transporter receptor subunit TctC